MNSSMNYLDGNAAAGELSRIFVVDITSAEGQCANCGAKRLFAEAHLYMQCPGLVARCALCGHVLLRLVNVEERVFLDLSGISHLIFDTTQHH
jgi:hypothetical protein